MNSRTTDYKLNNSVFRVTYGDITEIAADAVVSSDDNYISMGGGVSEAIRLKGGESIAEEARKHTPVDLGDAVVTSAGRLDAKYIFHAITIDYSEMEYASEESIEAATKKCLKLADSLGVKSIVFPALGTGAARFPFHLAAEVMTGAIADYLSKQTNIQIASLVLYAREGVKACDLDIFYERAVALASASTQSKRLGKLLDDLAHIVKGMDSPDLLERVGILKLDLETAQRVLNEHPEDVKRLDEIQSESNLGEIGRKIVETTSEAQATATWENEMLEAEVLRTKLSGLLTQLNVHTSNLNQFQIEKAKHGGQLVPPRVETAILETQDEIESLEASIRGVRKELAEVSGPK